MTGSDKPSIDNLELIHGKYEVIDVRSPQEFTEFHYPGSINVPLFSNKERAEVGTAYKQESPDKAKEIGLKLFSEKLPVFYEAVHSLMKESPNPIVITCARGGMRSGAYVSLLNSLGFPVLQLEGGIRSLRQYVQGEIERLSTIDWKAVVVGGNTGTRKTIWLEKLDAEGYPVLNLEMLASHRGSIFGHIGMKKRSQKMFEWLLVEKMQQLESHSYLIMEAESKRIGPVIIPEWLQSVKESGRFIELEDTMESRVNYLLKEYEPELNEEAFAEALQKLTRLKPYTKEAVDQALLRNDYYTVFYRLLEEYYDPRYSHKPEDHIEKNNVLKLNISGMNEKEVLTSLKNKIHSAVRKE
ncbi:tRNA 2-selenouridine(34) synthase MnmH [Alkalicoccus saliphilus]|jgi:tRNA 2-selenouridine synthase|uniref:tRNA 2-selenouridine(34) synthase MnmH n=1 Tax=Alkalicoccus saliphilus TaxID=200989 RepID=A0A2T4U7V3_9BACI|nr:tRNA 2-selenouridine(34) synthase MnmH [Alkalicoccus saliphilus]PTL39476.1 tRNA 2-selenouridine(34) synthase MnmH [Alkalicoccus saliphilus]